MVSIIAILFATFTALFVAYTNKKFDIKMIELKKRLDNKDFRLNKLDEFRQKIMDIIILYNKDLNYLRIMPLDEEENTEEKLKEKIRSIIDRLSDYTGDITRLYSKFISAKRRGEPRNF